MTIRDFLMAILTGTLMIGPAIFVGLERLSYFARLDAELKRWVVAVVAGVVGVAAWGLALWLGYVEQPPIYTPEYVLNGVWSYGVLTGYSAFMSATLLHGHLALNKQTFTFTPGKE